MENFTKEELKNLIIGSIIVISCLVIIAVYKMTREIWSGTEDTDYAVNATFNRTDGLVLGDKVRLAGVDVGRVTDYVLDDNYRAVLTFKIRSDIKIPDDSSASIISSGITGGKYVEIEPGGSEDFIEPGGEFSYTQDAIVLDELIDRVISMGKAKRKAKNKTETVEQKAEVE